MSSNGPDPILEDGEATTPSHEPSFDSSQPTIDGTHEVHRPQPNQPVTDVASGTGSADPTIASQRPGSDAETIEPTLSSHVGEIAAPSVPGYEILGELGRGGMGVVYQARQVGLNRTVALKMILTGAHAGTAALARFRAEAEAIAQLQHPNLIHIYEIGDCKGLPFFSLEFVEGGSLDRRIDGTPWKPREAARLVESLARAIHEAHRKGVIHRDLKPANILLTGDGTPKITDFGLAKRLDSASGQTHTGALLGTPSYMAPEQAEGKIHELGPAADTYALGTILYELLTGRPPFRAATPLETAKLVVTAEPVPPARLQPGLPRDIETICLKCLQKEPHRRYPDAAALARDLGHFLAGEPIEARRVGPITRAIKWSQRRPALAGLLGALLAVIALGVVAVNSQYQRAIRQKDRAERQRTRAEEQKARAERFLTAANLAREQAGREARRAEEATKAVRAEKLKADAQLYDTSIALAYREWLAGDAGRTRNILDACEPRFRGWEWSYLDGLGRADQLTLRGHDWWVVRARFTDAGKRVAALCGRGSLWTWDAQRGTLLSRIPGKGDPLGLSADGRLAVTGSGDDVFVWDLSAGGGPKTLRDGKGCSFNSALIPGLDAAFRPDGKRLAVGGSDKVIHIWDLDRGEPLPGIRNFPDRAFCLAYSPDGRRLASTGSAAEFAAAGGAQARGLEPEIRISDADSGALIRRWSVPAPGPYRLTFSPDGSRLASGGMDGSIRVWDAETGREVALLRGHAGWVFAIAFSPDGTQLASSSWDRTVRLWEIAGARELATFRGHELLVFDIAFSPDGRRLVSASMDRTAKVWDLQPATREGIGLAATDDTSKLEPGDLSQEFRTLRGHHATVQTVTFTPDGTKLISGAWDGMIRIWDVASGRPVREFSAHSQPISRVDLSPDGTRLMTASGGLMGTQAGEVKVWELASGRELTRMHAGEGPLGVAGFSPDGNRIASAVGGLYWRRPSQVRVWNASTGREVARVAADLASVLGLTFSPNGRQLITVGFDPGVQFWDAATGARARATLDASANYASVSYNRDGTLLAAGSLNGPVQVWNTATWQPFATFSGHTQGTFGVAFSPDNRRLATVGGDAAMRLWDLEHGHELLTLRHHEHSVFGVAFDRAGRTLATCGADGTIKLHDARSRPRSPRTDDWPMIFTDTFDRTEIGAGWESKAGRWSIDNGALRGELAAVSGDVNRATIVPRGLRVPQFADVRYDLWSPEPMVGELKFVDDAALQGLLAIFIGHADPNLNRGKTGVLAMSRDNQYTDLANHPTPEFRPGKRYRVRIVREPSRMTMFIDGTEALATEFSPRDLPELQLQGSWARPGAVVYFDNVEVRSPR